MTSPAEAFEAWWKENDDLFICTPRNIAESAWGAAFLAGHAAQRETDCKLVCSFCRDDTPTKWLNRPADLELIPIHVYQGKNCPCSAAAIRQAGRAGRG